MIHLSGPSKELKERFKFYTSTSTSTATATATTTQWAQAQPAQHSAPLEGETGGGDEGPTTSAHWGDSGSSSSFNTQNDDSSEDQAWLERHQEIVDPAESQGLELVGLLASCAEAIGCGDNAAAVTYFLCRLGDLASPRGLLPIHRVAAYFTEALALRAAKLWPQLFAMRPPREPTDRTDDSHVDDGTALRLLDQVSPIPKFLHFPLNERLLRAFEGKERVHIIDLGVKEGLQWPGLLQSLAARPNPPSHVRMTGIGDSRQELHDTGARLRAVAESLNLRFEFHPVVDKLEDVRLWMLHVKEEEEECVAVSCVLQLHRALGQGALTGLLGLIRSTNPSVVLVAEEEADHNAPRWETRFANSLRYYSAVFDSLHSCGLPEDSASRIATEEMYGRRIRDIVGREGRERVERHERFGRWRELMGGGGYRCLELGEREAVQSRMLLRMYSSGGEHYSIEEKRRGETTTTDALTLKFLDHPLYTVSAWAPL